MRVLVLGASGMLGSEVFQEFDGRVPYDVWGLVRNPAFLRHFSSTQQRRLVTGVDVLDEAALPAALDQVRPDVIINCVGLIKQKDHAEDPLVVLPVNAMLPHKLAALCGPRNVRLLHISTDCVFSGRKGMYTEADPSDAEDLYGKSKYIGELRDIPFAVTLRTSIVGRELDSNRALVDWFLSQQGAVVDGFRRSIFSGMTAIELARIMRDVVLPDADLHGLYHVSSSPISKFDFLKLVAAQYRKSIEVKPDDGLVIDRSLDSSRFQHITGYRPPSWESMIRVMHETGKQC
jgi:dTDP-4-dehydrorhamnose reductase